MPDSTADQTGRQKTPRKSGPKLRDGVMKRGNTWSYVIRVNDPGTGISKPKWVGGFATEGEAKAARDEGRVKARRGEYIDRNQVTVIDYLDDWIGSHAMEIKPRTLLDYRACIRLYVTPRIGPADPGRPAFHDHQVVPRPADQRRPRRPAPRRRDGDPPARSAQESIPRCRHRGRTHRQQPG